MNFKKLILIITLIVILICTVRSSLTQAAITGKIEGYIKDALTENPLPGANVILQGTSLGAATDLNGRFVILNVPPGSYTIVVRYIGYSDKQIDVRVRPNQIVTQDFLLDFVVLKGEEVVVTAQAEGQMEAINQQITSRTIENIVSDARIQELPDANAAESIGRLPGVSILRDAGEGNKVVIRGLSPKYNVITVNGVRIASTSASDRSVNLNVISPNVLAGISVMKSLTPDKDADALGGTVDLKLKEAPKGIKMDVLFQGGYNGQQSTYDMYKFVANISDRFFGNRLGILAQANLEQANRGSDQLNAGYELQREKNQGEKYAPIFINDLSLKDRLEIRHRYGGSFIFDFKLPNGKINLSNFGSRLYQDIVSRQNSYAIGENRHNYSLSDNEVTVDMFTNSLSVEQIYGWAKIDYGLSLSQSHRKSPNNRDWSFFEEAAFDQPESGEQLNELPPDKVAQYARNNLERSYLRDSNLNKTDTKEREITAQANVEVPFTFTDKITGKVKFGGKYRDKSRSYNREQWGWAAHAGYEEQRKAIYAAFPEVFGSEGQGAQVDIPMKYFIDTSYDPGKFLAGQYELGYTPDVDFMNKVTDAIQNQWWYEATSSLLDDYNGTERLPAGYIMSEINFGSRFMFLPGVRYERMKTVYTAKYGEDSDVREFVANLRDTTSTRINEFWLPMFHIRYKVTDWFDIRLARTKSLTRPDYSDFSPYRYIRKSGDVSKGNPELKPATATNYDLYLSFYGNKLGLFTFGAFYKEIENLIWNKQWTILDYELLGLPKATKGHEIRTTINNEYLAKFKGIELDWQTQFWYLPGYLHGIVLNMNYSHIFSETKYPYSLYNSEYLMEPPWFVETIVDTFRVGRMLHQPNDIVNIALGYDIGGFSARLSFLFQGSILSNRGVRPEVDGFTEDYYRWDLSIKQELPWKGVQLYMNVNNLRDRPDQSFQPTRGLVTAQEYYGLTGDIGIRYRFK
jgi:TonB-dependent receptor